jgi:hypothetical protein
VTFDEGDLDDADLDDALSHKCLDLGEDGTGATVHLPAPQGRHDAERAGVVAAHRDRDERAVCRVTSGGQRRGEYVQALEDLDLSLLVVTSAIQQSRKRAHVVGAEHDVHPGCPVDDGGTVLLSQAAADRNLHGGVLDLGRAKLTEVAVQLVVGVLPDGAGVEHDDVRGLRRIGDPGDVDIAGGLQQAGKPLGVMNVHLTPVGAHLIGLHRIVKRTCSFAHSV